MSDLGATISGMMQGAQALSGVGKVLGMGGPLAGAIGGGIVALLGANTARKRKQKMRDRLTNQQNRLRGQIPGIQEYFKELEAYKSGQIERKKGKAIEQFVESTVGTIPTMRRKIAQTGLTSGSAEKLLGSTRAKLGTSIENTLGDITSQEEDMLLAMDQQRQNQLQGIMDQITTLQSKKDSI